MNRFRRQFVVGTLLLLLGCAGVVMAHHRWSDQLPNYAFLSGWALLAVMILLALYNMRKRLNFLPLGSSEAWLQIHIYAGFFTVILFLAHVNFRVPTGWFEGVLAWLYLLVTGSGVAGLVLTRVLPRRLATRGSDIIYEKIPALRHALRLEAEGLVISVGSPLAEFYAGHLGDFFNGPKHFWLHLLDSRRPLNALTLEVEDMRRYLDESQRVILDKLGDLVRRKDGLDYYYALQATLKLWLFVHLPLTYSLMIFSAWHVVLVSAFSGGVR